MRKNPEASSCQENAKIIPALWHVFGYKTNSFYVL